MSRIDCLVLRVDKYMFGVDSRHVQDVFYPRGVTPVPRAPPEIAGLLNLRGRIVTAVCARSKLQLPGRAQGAPEPKAVGAEIGGDVFGLIVDDVEDVISVDLDEVLAPSTLPERWADLVTGVHRLDRGLLLMTDVRRFVLREHRAAA
jgi:purine-binding chemotaxis protein CheW